MKQITKTFTAERPGRYLSMTVKGRDISIHDSKHLEEGATMEHPSDAFVLLICAEPDQYDR